MKQELLNNFRDTQAKVRIELFEIMKDQCLSVRQVGIGTGVTPFTISRFLNGYPVVAATLMKINKWIEHVKP